MAAFFRCAAALTLVLAIGFAGCSLQRETPVRPGDIIAVTTEDGLRANIRVEAIDRDPEYPDSGVSLYSVSVKEQASGEWLPFCAPDAAGRAWAVPLSGFWDSRGDFHDSESVVTLACTSGVIGKCVRWGYVPWRVVNGRSLREHHLACVRMARADYCGNGAPNTRDGTVIDVFDLLGVQQRQRGAMAFEAAWSSEGATFVDHARWGSFDSIAAACPEKFQGRTSMETGSLTPEQIEAKWPQSLIFNDSYVHELQ